jgi:hypothetical protein
MCLVEKGSMKKIALILLTVALISCQDDNTAALPENSFSVNRNYATWEGITEIHLDSNTDTLTFLGVGSRPNAEIIVMKTRFQGLGAYPLTKNQGYYYTLVGGDVLTSEYTLAPNVDGQLVLSRYDSTKKILEGSFNVLLKKKGSSPANHTDVLVFTNGKFRGKVEN